MTVCDEIVPGIPKRDDEEILWQGQPCPSSECVRATGFFLIGVVWLAFLAFMLRDTAGGESDGAEAWIPIVFAVVMAPIGVFLVLAPLLAALVARKGRYAITTKRVAVYYVLFNWGEPIRWESSLSKIELKSPEKLLLGCDIVFDEVEYCKTDEAAHTKNVGFLSLKTKEAAVVWGILNDAIARSVRSG